MLRYHFPVSVCLSVTLVYCGQTAEWIKLSLGAEVGLGPRNTVLDGDTAASTETGTAAPTFRPMSTVAKRSPISATAELLLHDRPTAVVGTRHPLYLMQAFVQ